MYNSRTMGWREMLQQAIDEASRVGQGPDALRYIGQVTADRLSYGPTNRPVVAQVERKQEPAMELRPQGGQPRNRRRDLGMDPDQDYKCTICIVHQCPGVGCLLGTIRTALPYIMGPLSSQSVPSLMENSGLRNDTFWYVSG